VTGTVHTADEATANPCGFHSTDSGNAEVLAALYGDRLRYDHRRGRWLLWAGHSWRTDADGEIDRLALAAAEAPAATPPIITIRFDMGYVLSVFLNDSTHFNDTTGTLQL